MLVFNVIILVASCASELVNAMKFYRSYFEKVSVFFLFLLLIICTLSGWLVLVPWKICFVKRLRFFFFDFISLTERLLITKLS